MHLLRSHIASMFVAFCVATSCAPRDYGEGSVVCVCNSTYCDVLPRVEDVDEGVYQIFTSNKDGLRFDTSSGTVSSSSTINLYSIAVHHSKTYQTVKGFGGAFTDSAGINIAALSDPVQQFLLSSYYSTNGSEYTLGRVPIAGCDFSVRPYSYADGTPGSLDSFALQDEDYDYKIPYILKATNLSDGQLSLLASPWSSPPWMKTNNDFSGAPLLTQYYQLWAEYIVKFFEAYRENGVEFWSFTIQNEPTTGFLGTAINAIAWLPSQLVEWLCGNIGPTIRNSNFSDINIIVHDDQTLFFANVEVYLNNDAALSFLDGVAFHWYADKITPAAALDVASSPKKDIFMVYSEACTGFLSSLVGDPVVLGSWDRGEQYASSILEVLSHNGIGWIDWNLVLNTDGGPNWINNTVDAPIIANATADEFYKQPMYYVLAHFSKYIPRGSVRIDTSVSLLAIDVQAIAFKRPDNKTALVILNTSDLVSYDLQISDDINGYIYTTVSSHSISTIVY